MRLALIAFLLAGFLTDGVLCRPSPQFSAASLSRVGASDLRSSLGGLVGGAGGLRLPGGLEKVVGDVSKSIGRFKLGAGEVLRVPGFNPPAGTPVDDDSGGGFVVKLPDGTVAIAGAAGGGTGGAGGTVSVHTVGHYYLPTTTTQPTMHS